MTTETHRHREYLICQRRGHDPSDIMTAGVPPMHQCKWCGTYYRIDVIKSLFESNKPKPPTGVDRLS